MEVASHTRKHTVTAVDLVLGDDDLARVRVFGSRDGVLEETDCSNDLAFLDGPHLATLKLLTSTEVAGVANNLLGLDGLVPAANADELAISISHDLMNGLVEHVGSTVDGGETGERLGQFTKTIERVDVRRFAVTSHGRGVEDDTAVGLPGRLGDVAISLWLGVLCGVRQCI